MGFYVGGKIMRRKDREITDENKIEDIMSKCHCCRLGLNDNGEVYIVPLNFGFVKENGKYSLYFHGAKEGRKIDIMKNNNFAGFEMDRNYELVRGDTACNYTARYQSIIGKGRVTFVEDREEKIKGLSAIMLHTTGKSDWKFDDKMVDLVCVYKVDVEELSCKEHL